MIDQNVGEEIADHGAVVINLDRVLLFGYQAGFAELDAECILVNFLKETVSKLRANRINATNYLLGNLVQFLSAFFCVHRRLFQQLFQGQSVSVLERFDIGYSYALVEFVDGGVERAEFDQLRADVGDEATIGCAARGR